MNTIRLEKVSKVYDGQYQVTAVDEVSLEVAQGEFLCLAGPSGSGKTTLLNLIGGLDRPTSGRILIGDTDLTGLRRGQVADFRLRNLGFVFQEYNLIPVLTARENMEFGLLLQGISEAQRRSRVDTVLEELGLSGLADRKPSSMSGGQQQRVAVARAVVSQPTLVLADEPTANLDSANVRNLMEIMKTLNRTRSITFILASHDESVLKEVHRIVYLRDGRVVKDESRIPT